MISKAGDVGAQVHHRPRLDLAARRDGSDEIPRLDGLNADVDGLLATVRRHRADHCDQQDEHDCENGELLPFSHHCLVDVDGVQCGASASAPPGA